MTLDELKLWIQDPVVKQTLRDIIVSAFDKWAKEEAMRKVELFRDFDRPPRGTHIEK